MPALVYGLLQHHDPCTRYLSEAVQSYKEELKVDVQPGLALLHGEFEKSYKDKKRMETHLITEEQLSRASFQPIYSGNLLTEREAAKSKGLENLYVHIGVAFDTFNTLKFHKNYKTLAAFEDKLRKKQLKEYIPTAAEEELIISAAIQRAQLVVPEKKEKIIVRKNIKFHEAPFEMQFTTADGVWHLSKEALDPEITAKRLGLTGPGATGSVCTTKIMAELIGSKVPLVKTLHALAK